MKCFEFNRLAAYVDDVLSQEEKKLVEKHLEFCPSCREVVNALQKEDAFLLEAIQSPVLPAGFDDEVLSKLEPYQVKKKKRNWPYQLLTAASIVLALGVGTAFYSGIQEIDGGNAALPVMEEEKEALFSVKDEGVLLEVTDISASPLKIEVFYRLKPEEWVLEDYLKKHNVKHLTQVNEAYEDIPSNIELKDGKGQKHFYKASWIGKDRFEKSVVIKPSEVDTLPDAFKVKIQFKELFWQYGVWEMEIPVDIREAKEKTKKYSMQTDFQFEDFMARLIEWESSTNFHRLTLKTEYSDSEKKRLVDIIRARGENGEQYSMIMPEIMVVTENGKQQLIPEGTNSQSFMGQSFTTEFEFTNRLNGTGSNENLSIGQALKLVVQGFRLQEPENTQFELTDQSKNVQGNDWIIDAVTTEPETENSKLVTITGRTSIEYIEDFTVELKGINRIISTEIITKRITPEGTFVFQTSMPNSTKSYKLDIQSITKWVPFEKEEPLK